MLLLQQGIHLILHTTAFTFTGQAEKDVSAELERQMRPGGNASTVREAATVQQLRIEIQQLHQRYNSETRRLSQQLEEQEQVTAEIQQTNNSLQRQVGN